MTDLLEELAKYEFNRRTFLKRLLGGAATLAGADAVIASDFPYPDRPLDPRNINIDKLTKPLDRKPKKPWTDGLKLIKTARTVEHIDSPPEDGIVVSCLYGPTNRQKILHMGAEIELFPLAPPYQYEIDLIWAGLSMRNAKVAKTSIELMGKDNADYVEINPEALHRVENGKRARPTPSAIERWILRGVTTIPRYGGAIQTALFAGDKETQALYDALFAELGATARTNHEDKVPTPVIHIARKGVTLDGGLYIPMNEIRKEDVTKKKIDGKNQYQYAISAREYIMRGTNAQLRHPLPAVDGPLPLTHNIVIVPAGKLRQIGKGYTHARIKWEIEREDHCQNPKDESELFYAYPLIKFHTNIDHIRKIKRGLRPFSTRQK